MRRHIILTLIRKEALRYRYNLGLVAMVAGILVLSLLISISARMELLPGQGGMTVEACYVYYPPSANGEKWARYLRQHPPADADLTVNFRAGPTGKSTPKIRAGSMAIELIPPEDADGAWDILYWHLKDAPQGILPYRDWLSGATKDFLGIRPKFTEETRTTIADLDRSDQIPLVVTALVLFSLYLVSFNLYATSTGEEREKRVLLALMLTPASPGEIFAAKVVFYVSVSLFVSVLVAALYEPRLLLNPTLWVLTILGSTAYVAIGTVVVTLIRRQSTLSSTSMMYLIVTSSIIFLSQFAFLFVPLRFLLVEHWLHAQLFEVISEQSTRQLPLRLGCLAALTLGWSVVAVRLFGARGMSVSQGRD